MIDKNKLAITGNLVATPELRYTPSGRPVANGRIIHTDSRKDKETGEWKKGEPMGLNFTVWGPYAEAFVKKVRKGTAVLLEGPLKPDTYKKDGVEIPVVRLEVQEFQVIAQPRAKEGEQEEEPAQGRQPKSRNNRKNSAAND